VSVYLPIGSWNVVSRKQLGRVRYWSRDPIVDKYVSGQGLYILIDNKTLDDV